MRLSIFLVVIVVATFSVLASAKKANTVRLLKGTQTDDQITAEDEERGMWDGLLTKMKANGLIGGVEKGAANAAATTNIAAAEKAATNVAAAAGTGNKWQSSVKKVKELENVKNVEGQAAAAAAVAGTGNKWQSTAKKVKELEKVKVVEGQTTAAAAAAAKNWENVAKAVESGAHLKKVDTTNSMWKTAFAKYKENPQRLKDVTEAQAVQITKAAAKEVAKNPSKWRYVKKFLELPFGAALTALFVVGINSMLP